MIEALIAACATVFVGGLSLLGVVITNSRANNKMQNDMKVAQAVTDTKLDNLASEVHTHNNFAQRIPGLEKEQIANNRRLKKLEEATKPIASMSTEIEDIKRRLKTLECYHVPN